MVYSRGVFGIDMKPDEGVGGINGVHSVWAQSASDASAKVSK